MNRRVFLKATLLFLGSLVCFPKISKGISLEKKSAVPSETNSLAKVNRERLISIIHDELTKVANLFVADPNDKVTRMCIVASMEKIMNYFYYSGQIQSFYIICDETNNPPSVVDANEIDFQVNFVISNEIEVTVIDGTIASDDSNNIEKPLQIC